MIITFSAGNNLTVANYHTSRLTLLAGVPVAVAILISTTMVITTVCVQ